MIALRGCCRLFGGVEKQWKNMAGFLPKHLDFRMAPFGRGSRLIPWIEFMRRLRLGIPQVDLR